MPEFIARPTYLDWLREWKDRHIIKIVTGVRRCGKSTLLKMYRDYLLSTGIQAEQIIYLNLEILQSRENLDFYALYAQIKEQIALHPALPHYVILDEVQLVDHFEKACNSLLAEQCCDLYLTGSNAYLFSSELATLLSGRCVELRMLPLSFKEYCSTQDLLAPGVKLKDLYLRYLQGAGFPFVVQEGLNENATRVYLSSLIDTILLRDTLSRHAIKNTSLFLRIVNYLVTNIGSYTSPGNLAATLKGAQSSADRKTVESYLAALTQSLLFYEVRRYNIKGRQLLVQNSKYYLCDISLRQIYSSETNRDVGHSMENVVFLELKRRYDEVYVGQLSSDAEVDFVALRDGRPAYFQVAATVTDPEVLQRELKPLQAIRDNYPKYLITMDETFGDTDYLGITKMNLLDFLLQ